jgi:hypothetical protein
MAPIHLRQIDLRIAGMTGRARLKHARYVVDHRWRCPRAHRKIVGQEALGIVLTGPYTTWARYSPTSTPIRPGMPPSSVRRRTGTVRWPVTPAAREWPAITCWRELAPANPEALVLLPARSSAEEWWNSVSKTPFAVIDRDFPPHLQPIRAMNEAKFERFTPHWRAAMPRWRTTTRNAAVRAAEASAWLIDWQPRDGWEPICSALGTPVPDIAFRHANTFEDFSEERRRAAEPVAQRRETLQMQCCGTSPCRVSTAPRLP